ncbi:Phosphatidylglycerol/phosphatidylinositol transfer protein [Boothiomyces sp. JEL0866]|nr:Phosphatidylglycerol/phosphatidylinositol transfer protein [Boothiomyces sp. JEL0866]
MKSTICTLIALAFAAPPAVGPLASCGSASDSFNPTSINLTPYPIQIGKPLLVNASGILSRPIAENTTITLTVKKFGFSIYSKTVDFCETAKKVNRTCPIPIGEQSIQIMQNVSSGIVSGNYGIEIKVNDANKAQIACMSGLLTLQ